jgi:hypothetical protein
MSAIYLNLGDVRNLLLALGRPRPETVGHGEALDIIASGLGVSSKFLTTFTGMPGSLDAVGIPLHKERLVNLVHLISTHDTAVMKNTKRLEMLAAVFDRPADAMMHKLKSDVATQGKNTSLDFNANPLPSLKLDHVSFDDADAWKSVIGRMDGLCIVVGSLWATRSVLDPSLSHLVSNHKVGIAAFDFNDFDLLHPMRDSGVWKEKMNAVVNQAMRHSQVLCLYGARDVWDMDFAIEFGGKVPTFVSASSPEAMEGVRHLAGKADYGEAEFGLDVKVLNVIDPVGCNRFTSNLRSRMETLRI